MPGGAIGTIFVELDLDATRYTNAQKAILAGAKQNSADINKVFKTVGITSDAMYDAMRKNVTNALGAIKQSHTSTANEIVRAEKGAADKIKAISAEQYGTQAGYIEKLKGNWVAASAAVVAAWTLVNKAVAMMDEGAKALQVESSFKIMADAAGVNSEKMIESMKRVTRETVDDSDMMAKAIKLMLQGYNPEQIERFSAVAITAAQYAGTTVSEAYERLADALANRMPKAMKQLGAVTTEQFKLVQEAVANGAGEMVLYELAMVNLEKKQKELQGTQDSATIALQQFHAEVKNAKEAMGKGMLEVLAAFYKDLQLVAAAATWAAQGITKLLEARLNLKEAAGLSLSESERRNLAEYKEISAALSASAKDLYNKGTAGAPVAGPKATENELADAEAKVKAKEKELAAFKIIADAKKEADSEAKRAAEKAEADAKRATEKAAAEEKKIWDDLYQDKVDSAIKADKEIWDAHKDLQEAFKRDEINRVDAALRMAFGDIDKAADDYTKALEEAEDRAKKMMDNIQDYSADAVYNILSGFENGWGGLMDSIKEMFLRTMSEMIAKQYIMPIIVPIVQSVMGGMGSALGLGSSGGSSMGSSLGLARMGGSFSNILNTPFGSNPFGGGVDPKLMGIGNTYGSMLGAAGLGSLGYSLGGMFGLPQGGYSGIGSAVGGALGSLIPIPGVGTALGALAGGLLGSLFGGKDTTANYKSSGRMLNFGTSSAENFGGSWLQDSFDRAVMGKIVPAVDALMSSTEKTIKILPDTIEAAMMASLSGGIKMPGMDVNRKTADEDIAKWIAEIAGSITSEVYSAAVKAGFESGAAYDTFVAWMQSAAGASSSIIGSAFKDSIMTNDFTQFGLSVKDAVFSSVSDGLLEALMQSEMFQGALQPLFYGVQNALNQSLVNGEFDAALFNTLATPYLGQVNDVLSDLQPAFDTISQTIMNARGAVYEGTTPATGITSGQIAGYTAPAATNVTINVTGLLDTNDAAQNLNVILQNMKDYDWSSLRINV